MLLGYLIAAALPWTRKGFQDARTADMGVGRDLSPMLRIPIGTALMEVAFRGVLLAAFTGTWGSSGRDRVIVAVRCVACAAGLEFHEASATTDRLGNSWRGKLTTVLGQVVGTGVAGVGFCLVRIWSGSLLPSIALHASLNAPASPRVGRVQPAAARIVTRR